MLLTLLLGTDTHNDMYMRAPRLQFGPQLYPIGVWALRLHNDMHHAGEEGGG